jgi:hypothetical protein
VLVLVKVIVLPAHTVEDPEIADGAAISVIEEVTTQPPLA